jgi:hypothetical protein
MGHESNRSPQLSTDLPLVDVIGQAVRNHVVGEVLDVVLRARLGSSSGVSRDTEHGGLSTEVRNNGSNGDLRGGGIATRVGNTSGLGNLGAANQLGKTVGPLAVETVVSAQVDNHVSVLSTLVDCIHKGLADTVGESHNPAVNVAVGRHALDIFGAEVLVDDLALVVALQLLASQLARRDVSEVKVGVGVNQADESLSGVATGTDESDLGGLGVGLVLLSEGRVRVGCGVRADRLDGDHWASSTGGAESIASGGECALLPGVANVGSGLSSALESGLEVEVTEHLATVLGELLDEELHLLAALNTVPEEHLTLAAQTAIGLVKEPGKVLVILLDSPDELGVVLLDGGEHVVRDVGQPTRLGDGESSQVSSGGNHVLLRGENNSKSLHRLIKVSLEIALLETLNIAVNGRTSVESLAITDKHILEGFHVLKLGKRGPGVHLVASSDQRTGSRVGKKLLLQVGRVNDGNAGGTGKIAEKLLHLLDLQASTVAHPPLLHQVVVFLIKVDGGDLLASVTVEQSTLFGEVNDLQRLESAGQFSGSDIGVDIKDLAIGGLGHGCKDRQAASVNGGLNWRAVHAIDLAHQVVLLLVEVIGLEDTGGERASPHAHALQFLNQLQVLLQEKLPGKSQGLSVRHTDTVFELRLDTGSLEHAVQLGTGAVDDDRVQSDMVQEGKGGGEGLEVFGNDSTADLDNGKLLLGD